jgi:DNA-binding NarL/FixJ family response regulator
MMKAKLIAQPIIGVAVIDDDPIRLAGLRSILQVEPSFCLIDTSITLIAANRKASIVMLRHSGAMFLDTIAEWRVLRPDLKVIVTAVGAHDESIFNAIASGAKGYVDERVLIPELVEALRTVHSGSVWLPRRIISMIIERSGRRSHVLGAGGFSPTARQKQVLRMLVEGRSNKEIGSPLGIKERMVKTHLANLMHKVGVKNRIALSVFAVRYWLVPSQCESNGR